MHPKIIRVNGGKNQKRVIEMAHALYEYKVDVLDKETSLDIFELEEDAYFLMEFLQTDDVLKRKYSNYFYNEALNRIEKISKILTNKISTIKRNQTIQERNQTIALELKEKEYQEEKIAELKEFSKKRLARALIKYLTKEEIDKVISAGKSAKQRAENKKLEELQAEPL